MLSDRQRNENCAVITNKECAPGSLSLLANELPVDFAEKCDKETKGRRGLQVNKPYLPLASGALSMRTGVALCLITGVLSIGLGIASNSRPLLATLVLSLALGVAYSTDLPFLRWKRYPALAAMCILAVRCLPLPAPAPLAPSPCLTLVA